MGGFAQTCSKIVHCPRLPFFRRSFSAAPVVPSSGRIAGVWPKWPLRSFRVVFSGPCLPRMSEFRFDCEAVITLEKQRRSRWVHALRGVKHRENSGWPSLHEAGQSGPSQWQAPSDANPTCKRGTDTSPKRKRGTRDVQARPRHQPDAQARSCDGDRLMQWFLPLPPSIFLFLIFPSFVSVRLGSGIAIPAGDFCPNLPESSFLVRAFSPGRASFLIFLLSIFLSLA